MNIGYHVWRVPVSDEYLRVFGFTERDGYWDKTTESQMTKDYIKIYRDIL